MKKALLLVAAIALVVWVVSWFRNPQIVATSAARQWPGDMGSLDDADDRYPPLQANEASRKLTALAGAVPKNEAVDQFVWREIARGESMIGVPPSLPDVAAIRDLLLAEPVVWERRIAFDDGQVIGRRPMQMNVARMLIASALAKARAGDATAWDDLRAAWNLARSLHPHPQMMMQTAALTIARMINAVAWKMPLPAPEWLAELQARDHVRPLLDAYQYQAASYVKGGSGFFPTKILADDVERDRGIAEEVFNETGCDVSPRMNQLGTDLTSVWRRAFRYRAEREATANAIRIREGKPIETKSVCSDGTWSFDGSILRFTRETPTVANDVQVPLALRVQQ